MSENRKQVTYALSKRTPKLLQCAQYVIIYIYTHQLLQGQWFVWYIPCFEGTAERFINYSGKLEWRLCTASQLIDSRADLSDKAVECKQRDLKQGGDVSKRWNRWNTPSQFHLNIHHMTYVCIYSIDYWDISPIQLATIVHIRSTALSYS